MAGSKPSTLKGQQQKKRGKLSQEYVSDDDDGSDADVKPKANKKAKTKREASDEDEQADNDDDDEEEEEKGRSSSKMQKNDEGDAFVKLSDVRRVTVRKFKGKVMVDIRETYSKDGKDGLPGKKGISLTLEQWEKLTSLVPTVDKAISDIA